MSDKTYTVYGDYGYMTEAVLFKSESKREAIQWAIYFTRDDDLEGYKVIEVATFNPDGEYVTHWVKRDENPLFYFEVE